MSEMTQTIITYLVSAMAVVFALMAVTSRRTFRSAVYLMLMLAMAAGFYVLLGAELLAGVQLMVYVGGIVVLLVFAVMLTTTMGALEPAPDKLRVVAGILGALAFFGSAGAALVGTGFQVLAPGAPPANNTAAIGEALFDTGAAGYVLPFEVLSLLLLAAVIGGIVVARKGNAIDGAVSEPVFAAPPSAETPPEPALVAGMAESMEKV
jgi:NADH-quinone oxidoreductase subunit J